MKTYTIYPAKNRPPLELVCSKIAVVDNVFIIYNEANQPAKDGFFAFDQVAAIIPDRTRNLQNPRTFLVYLKERIDPVPIAAHSFKLDTSRLIFLGHTYDVARDVINEWELEEIYFAKSEVIAVLPDGGLRD